MGVGIAGGVARQAGQPVELVVAGHLVAAALVAAAVGVGHAHDAPGSVIGEGAQQAQGNAAAAGVAQRVGPQPAVRVMAAHIGLARAPAPGLQLAQRGVGHLAEHGDGAGLVGAAAIGLDGVERDGADAPGAVVAVVQPRLAGQREAAQVAHAGAVPALADAQRGALVLVDERHLRLGHDPTQAVVAVGGGARFVGEAAELAGAVVGHVGCAAVVGEDAGHAAGEADAREPPQLVVAVGAGLAAGVGARLEPAVGIVGGTGAAGVGADQGAGLTQAVGGVGGGELARVGDAPELVQPVPAQADHWRRGP